MTILIAEDDPGTLRLLEKAVRACGHDVSTASDGQQAWDLFTGGDFNFVLTDWQMPVLDGVELCRRIRGAARLSYVYVIMVTSRGGQENFLAGMNAGADDFIIKPIDQREIQVRLRAAERVLNLEKELRDKNQQLEVVNTRLRHLSRLDALMQIGNRLAFEERITEFHQRALRYGDLYSVIMCDVDQFKAYNDSQGHLAGDEVLRCIAGSIQQCLRSSDGAFRYGGEEIVVLLPRQSFREAARVAARLRARVEALQLPRLDAWLSPVVTVSCGVASYPLEGHPALRWEAVVDWADQALYRAKANGRNRVEVAEVCRQAPRIEPTGVRL